MDLNSVNSETKSNNRSFLLFKSIYFSPLDESVDFFIDSENPEDWDSSMINDEESLFLAFDEDRLNDDGIEGDF